MAFSQTVINEAWARAGGKCECTRQNCPEHSTPRCGKVLDPANQRVGMKWHAHHLTAQAAGGSDSLSNCQILCVECHEQTQSYGA